MKPAPETPHDERARYAQREKEKNEEQARLVREGKAIDVKAAFLRCFGGEAKTTDLKGY